MARTPIAERFTRYLTPGDPDECWIWQGTRNPAGYGQIWDPDKARPEKAHRVAWMIAHGDPGDLHVLHRCDIRSCCNPAHLYLGTPADNMRDKVARGRARGPRVSGQDHWTARLSDAEVEEIRTRYKAGGITQRALGTEYGVTQAQISHIVRRIQRIPRTPKESVCLTR